MKKYVILAAIAAAMGVTGSAIAQSAGPKGGAPTQEPTKQGTRKNAGLMNEATFTKLKLTDAQKTKLKEHAKEMREKMKALRKGNKGAKPTEEQKEKMKELRKENMEFLKKTLTKAQLQEFQKLRRERMKDRKDDK